MSEFILHREPSPSQAIALPEPRGGNINIRVAMPEHLKLIDHLQKQHSRSLGFATLGELEQNIAKGHVLLAEQDHQFVGYCTSKDKYKEHENIGIIYQLAVVQGKQRGLIGATLIKEVFNRAAYGCRLFCCWCAQDLEANSFWESLGFVPLAFRTGSRRVRLMNGEMGPRIHIFWQRRIREGDHETSYWFPSETRGGAVKEGRLVLPMLPGMHWRDAKPAVLPGPESGTGHQTSAISALLPSESDTNARKPRTKKPKLEKAPDRPKRGLWFAPPEPPPPTEEEKKAAKAKERAAKVKPPRFKNDPKLIAAAREMRDRYIDQINAGLLLPPSECGKYDVSRQLEAAPSWGAAMTQMPLLNAA